MIDLSQQALFSILFFTGFLSGTIDAIAGGGGLISVPILLTLGVPPHVALGTNKLQSMVGITISTTQFYRNGLISLYKIYRGLLFGFIGSILGSLVGQFLDDHLLKKIVPLFLIIILFYAVFSPKLGVSDKKPIASENWFFILSGLALGFYDGFFGPGTGSFWIFLLTFFLGYNLTKATAYTKIFNLNSNLIATLCFAVGHNINYRIALIMAVGQIIGSRVGVHLAIKNGAKLIRVVFIVIVGLTIVSLLRNAS